ncbi:DUF2956 domain-containing protein [Endozoicomonas sp. OPT23]|uniref:DUF2956 domain-containing protein n=1 Tax=Endozoicomonas sp. OPT23 TaxID=2072845 RepID=UPI00129A4518|nr:DUF2956 domain-containing protein [Endozoicomonas sp. OPT23]MRI32751.1 DUF2956 domain-containing protein [Endozoicomonas sp. OPT23]
MAKSNRNSAPKAQEEAIKIAKATQRPGQNKEQTKLIAKGIQKGIEEYKKQQKEKARELDKTLKKVKRSANEKLEPEVIQQEKIVYRQHWLPWMISLVSLSLLALQFAWSGVSLP